MEYLVKPWGHQLQAIERAKVARDFALLFDMGTGKTATTINILRHKYMEHRKLLRTLILCPPVVCENWRREFNLHSKVGHQVFVLKGSQTKRNKLFDEKIKLAHAPIFVTNYEGLLMTGLVQRLLNWGVEMLVCDESHLLKSHDSKRTKIAILLADQAKHRYILTGTPILNSPMDIWSQYRILDKGESFRDYKNLPLNFYSFRNRYFEDKNSGMPSQKHFPKWVLQEGAYDEINRVIYQKAMRVMKKDCMDLPPLIRQTIEVEMSPEQQDLYEEMKAHFIAYLDSGEAVTAQIALTKALRLQQIVSGFVKTEDGKEITLEASPRLKALGDLLQEIPANEKVIVWATFQENYGKIAALCDSLGYEYRELHGAMKGNRQEAIDDFNQNPKVKVMIANQASGGVGCNLQAASYAIFYSKNFSLGQDLQAEGRNYRGGSEIHERVTRIDLVSPGTIDEIVNQALSNKLDMAEKILTLRSKL